MSTRAPPPYHLDNVRSAVRHYLLGRSAGAVAGLLSAILLVRHMAIQDYAGYIAVMGVAGIVAMLASLGLDRVVTRFVPEGRLFQSQSMLAALVWRMLGARFLATGLVTLCLAVAWPWVVGQFDFVALPDIPLPLAIYLVASAFQLMGTVLQALVRQRLLTQVTVIQWGGRLIWIIVLVYQGGNIGLQQALWVMAIPELAGAIVMLFAVGSALRQSAPEDTKTEPGPRWPNWHELRYLAAHSYGFNILASLPQGYFMRTLVAATLPVETVAAYGFFSSLVDRLRVYLPIQLMYNLVEPVLVARYLQTKDHFALTSNTQLMYKANVFILAAALVFILIGGHVLVGFVTKGRFLDLTWILVLLLVQLVSGSHVLSMQLVLNVLKANQILSAAGLYALAVMLIFIGSAIFFNQAILILFGTLLYSFVLNFLALALMRWQSVPYRLRIREIGSIVGLGVGLGVAGRAAVEVFAITDASAIGSLATLGVCGFMLTAFLFNIFNPQELQLLFSMVRSRSALKQAK